MSKHVEGPQVMTQEELRLKEARERGGMPISPPGTTWRSTFSASFKKSSVT